MTTTVKLPRSTPEAQGISSAAILDFLAVAERTIQSLHSVMLLRHGQVVAEGWWAPYAPAAPHMMFSLSKSFTSTAIGLLIDEGKLSLDAHVLEFFPDDAPAAPNEHLRAMQVRHLLGMSTGHTVDTTLALRSAPDGNWARAFLACPVERAPGTHFLYNTGATYMLSAILQQLTGITLLEYLEPRLLAPLGIEGATWQTCPRGINTGGFGLSTTTEAVANFGQLYLQGGLWQGRQIVPRAWVDEATASHISNGTDPASDWAQGYGYQFWRCMHGGYRGDGAFGQYCVVLPEQDAVLAITGGLQNMQSVLTLVWERLLPAMGAEPLAEDAELQAALRTTLGRLALQPVRGAATGQQIAGRSYRLAPSEFGWERITFDQTTDGIKLSIEDARGTHAVVCGAGSWQLGETSLTERGETLPVAVVGAWPHADTFQADIIYYTTPFRVTLDCRFVGDRLLLHFGENVAFGATEFPPMVGQLEG